MDTIKTALITGGAGGIGRAVAERLASEGNYVIVTDLNGKTGQETADALDGLFIHCDLKSPTGCRDLIDQIHSSNRHIDILINNAGFQYVAPVDTFPEDTWLEMMQVMVTAPFLLTKYVWPDMQSRGWGRIVNISSIHGLVASPFKSGYVTAKHGLIGLTKTTALEGADSGITVNALCPAYVRTPLVEKQIADQARSRGISEDEVINTVMLEPAAIKRLVEPEEVADTIAYLCSDAASSVTGAAWTMDLGWTAR